jgi:cobalt-zinc-cadmium efflux system outer membrane protein
VQRKILYFVLSSVVFAATSLAQVRLGVEDAVNRALQSRASLKAEAERVKVAEGARLQAGLRPNPEFQFQNENLRPGQTYDRDVDTLAMINQQLDVLGKRPARIATAEQGVQLTKADYDLARWRVAQRVRSAYWTARGLQETRDILRTTAEAFQKTVDFNAARFSTGAIPEQDLLRVRLEQERLRISGETAAIEASHATIDLLREMGQSDVSEIVLSDSLAVSAPPDIPAVEQVLAQRADILTARAALAQASANARLQVVAARPDLNVTAGYKRTQLPDTNTGVNTAIVSMRVTLPFVDKNQGNRGAAEAEVRKAEQQLAAVETDVRAEYAGAVQEFRLRQREFETMLAPLREHAATISQIANAAYEQGGVDLLRFLDAERTRLDAELAWTRGMIEYRQSLVRLEAAEGVRP